MTPEEQKYYDERYAEFIAAGSTPEEAAIEADIVTRAHFPNSQTGEDKEAYQWLTQLPPGFKPQPLRPSGDVGRRGETYPYRGEGLVDSRGNLVYGPDGKIKTINNPEDVQGILRSIPYPIRRDIANTMKALKLYGTGSPSANVDQLVDFNAFARVLYTGNQEGLSWDAALQLIAERSKDLPGRTGKVYKSGSISEIKRAIQAQAQETLGRSISAMDAKSMAQRVAQRQIATQRKADAPGATQTAPSVGGIIEQQVAKEFKPEADAYRFAQFAQRIFGSAGGGEGVGAP